MIGFDDEGYAHVITRGVGKMIIFEDDTDYKYYIKLMHKYADEENITVCAYCLMDNHSHILLKYRDNNLSVYMHKLSMTYSKYFNKKYDRTGHLFQNRYKFEAVEDESYFLTVTKYIIQNPEKAGICKANDYRWSSIYDYGSPTNFVDISVAVGLLGGLDRFYTFVTNTDDNDCLEYDDDSLKKSKEKEENLSKLIVLVKSILEVENVSEINKYNKKQRNESILKLRNAGLSIRQIERSTGISRGVIQRINKS